MPRFGVCAPVSKSAEAKSAGWEFIEENVQVLLRGTVSDEQWQGAQAINHSVLPLYAANCLVPADMKITGPDVDLERLRTYIIRVLKRAFRLGMKTLVFGSGAARKVPEEFDRATARQQIIDFASLAAPIAFRQNLLLVLEHLNKGETNIINSVAEALDYVKAVNHPGFQCMVDTFHFWTENESLQDLQAALPWIKHVHLADKDGRTAPGESGKSDYRPLFRVLKQGGYNGQISVEAIGFNDIAGLGPKVLAFIKTQWDQA